MAMLSFCGIDVSKDRLDVVVLPEQQCLLVHNDAAGRVELVKQLRGLAIAAVGLEKQAEVSSAASCELCWRPTWQCIGSIRSS
jgi:hypothetical protein